MNRFKFQALMDEFPFLGELAHDDALNCAHIRIGKIDQNLLLRLPQHNEAIGSMVSIDNKETISFTLKDGSVIQDAVAQHYSLTSNYAHDDGTNRPGETILEAIARHDVAKTLHYVVLVKTGYEVANHHSTKTWTATVYKPAKDDLIPNLIAWARQQARDQVKAEANF